MAVSDLHGEVGWIPEAVGQHSPDLLLCAGDWGDPGEIAEADFRPILACVRVLTVFGNHDDRELLAGLRNRDGTPVLLGQGEVRRLKGLTIAGVSGIWAKTKLGSRLNARWDAARRRNPRLRLEEWMAGRPLPPYVTDEELAQLAARLAGRGVDILVSHACAVGLADDTPTGRRGGQRSFREVVNRARPRISICGHLHHQQRQDLPNGRAALNTGHGAVGEGWLIDWRKGSWSAEPLPKQAPSC